jgi:LPXTG-site transpeptidase (sortase) family protein
MFSENASRDAATLWPKISNYARQKSGRLRLTVSALNGECVGRALLGPALIIAGIALLAYVATEYSRMFAEQHRLAHQWQQQNQPGVTPKPVDDGLTKLLIPKIKLDAIVVEGTSRRQLLLGPGHMRETPAPGEEGNSVITAHRDTFFRHIYELKKGDILEVRRSGKIYTYEVTGKKVTDPEDLSVLRPSKDKRLTLITCYPTYYIGPAPERLVVFAKMLESQGATEGGPGAAKPVVANTQ